MPFAQQLGESGGPVVFINTFSVAPEDVDPFLEAWRADGEFMKMQPGYVSTQLHRGIAGSATFVNVAVWESVEAFRSAASSPEFQASLARYPASAVASRDRETERHRLVFVAAGLAAVAVSLVQVGLEIS